MAAMVDQRELQLFKQGIVPDQGRDESDADEDGSGHHEKAPDPHHRCWKRPRVLASSTRRAVLPKQVPVPVAATSAFVSPWRITDPA